MERVPPDAEGTEWALMFESFALAIMLRGVEKRLKKAQDFESSAE